MNSFSGVRRWLVWGIVLGGVLWSTEAANAKSVTIFNDVPRLDTNGNIVNAHDGSLMRYNGTWYLYGTVYEACKQTKAYCTPPCGYNPNTFALYTSVDLVSWKYISNNILPAMGKDNDKIDYWMPDVAFNPVTKMFVMQYWSSACGFHEPCANVATSSSPLGPFEPLAPMVLRGGVASDQMGLVVDYGDGSKAPVAYVRHNTIGPPKAHVLEELDATWTKTTGRWIPLFPKPSWPWMDGGGMFRSPVPASDGSPGLFMYMTGSDCCFCSWGSDTRVFSARDPLGPWHPGVLDGWDADPEMCDLTGEWECVSSPTYTCPASSWSVTQQGANFSATMSNGTVVHGWVEDSGYVHLPNIAPVYPLGVVTSSSGKATGCDRVRWYGDETAYWCRHNMNCSPPSPLDATEVNYCADGSIPSSYGPSSPPWINPCSNDNPWGTNFTVPAQQFNVLIITPGAQNDGPPTKNTTILYYGERSRTAPDGLKAHNFQAWVPLKFDPNGTMLPMDFPQQFNLTI